MKRTRWRTLLLVWFGILIPVGTLVFGWGYASVRENRLKDRIIADMEARGDPGAAHERSFATWHRRVEAAGLASLTLLLAAAAWATCVAVKRQRELADKKTAFVAAVTHELRTPLTTLRMHAEMLEEGLVPADRLQRVYGELSREANRLSRVVENVLAMSKLEDGRWVLDKRRGDFSAAVKKIIEALEPRAHELGFRFHVSVDDSVALDFDPRALELVTHNLVDNALKFAAGHDPREVDVSVAPVDAGVELVVRDHGPGIDRALRDRVFDRFERGGQSEKPGTGLGLALVRELARAHGGDARIVDGDRGTAIAVWFPLHASG